MLNGTTSRRHERLRVEFREPRTAAELRDILRLRRDVFRDSGLGHFEPDSGDEIAIDRFDREARHFGLFRGDGRPLACMRLVADEGFRHAPPHHTPVGSPLPIFEYWPEIDALRAAYRGRKACGGTVIEVGRNCIVPACRSLATLTRMIECVAAVSLLLRPAAIFVSCFSTHRLAFERWGFRRVPGTSDVDVPGVGVGACLMLTLDRLAPRVERRARTYVDQLRRTGAVPVTIVAAQRATAAA